MQGSEQEFLRNEIFSRYGSIKRARGAFLYTAKNVRLTDLYLDDGRAVLGWGGGSSFTMLKNALSRGITGPYKTDFSYRLEKAVSALLASEKKVFVFPNKSLALEAAIRVSKDNTSVWKPWLSASPDWASVDAVIIDPPFSWSPSVALLCLKPSLAEGADLHGMNISAPLEAAITRSLYDLKAAIAERGEKDWFLWDKVLCKYWERRGPYLYIRKDVIKKEAYASFVCWCLDSGVVINPCYGAASLVPFGADRGVFTKLGHKDFFAGGEVQ